MKARTWRDHCRPIIANELENMGWTVQAWKANGGYANAGRDDSRGKENKFKERIWFSPFCNRELTLF